MIVAGVGPPEFPLARSHRSGADPGDPRPGIPWGSGIGDVSPNSGYPGEEVLFFFFFIVFDNWWT